MMTRLFRMICLAAGPLVMSLVLTAGAVSAQAAPLQPDKAFALTVRPDGQGALQLTWDIADGYYLYRSRFSAEIGGSTGDLTLPKGETHDDPWFGPEEIFRGTVTARLASPAAEVTLGWQGCQEDGICYAPQTVRLSADGAVLAPAERPDGAPGGGWSAQAAPASPPDAGGSGVAGVTLAQDRGLIQGLEARGGRALVIAGFLGFGVLLAFTPCVFPMFPIVAGMLAGQGQALTVRRGLVLTAVYVVAMAAAFGLLGLAAGWTGANLQIVLQSPAAVMTVAGLFVLLAASMFGFYELQLPAALQARLGRASGRRGSVGGAAVLGFTSALIMGPCVTAPLAGALIYIAQTGDAALGAAALFALGLGQGLPLLAVGLFGPRILPRGGNWMTAAKQVFGVIFLGFAVWLAGRVVPGPVTLALWAGLLVGVAVFLGALDRLETAAPRWRRLSGAVGVLMLFAGLIEGVGAAMGAADPLRPLAPLADRAAPSLPADGSGFTRVSSRSGLEQALAQGADSPALVYVTADWCVVCRAIERGPLADPAVTAALTGLTAIKVDVSDVDAEAQALMRDLAVAGPPTMIFLDAARAEAGDSRLIGSLDSRDLLASIDRVTR